MDPTMDDKDRFEFADLGIDRREGLVSTDFGPKRLPLELTMTKIHRPEPKRGSSAPVTDAAAPLVGQWHELKKNLPDEQRDLDAEALGTISGGHFHRLARDHDKLFHHPNKTGPSFHHRPQAQPQHVVSRKPNSNRPKGSKPPYKSLTARMLQEEIAKDDGRKPSNAYKVGPIPPFKHQKVEIPHAVSQPIPIPKPTSGRPPHREDVISGWKVTNTRPVTTHLKHPVHEFQRAAVQPEAVTNEAVLPVASPEPVRPVSSSSLSSSSAVGLGVASIEQWRIFINMNLLPPPVLEHGITFHEGCVDLGCGFRKVPQEVHDEYKSARKDRVRREYQDLLAEEEELNNTKTMEKEVVRAGLRASRYAN